MASASTKVDIPPTLPTLFARQQSRQQPAYTFHALILDALLRQSLVTIRSLGKRGYSIAAMGDTPHTPAFASRWCTHKFVQPTSKDPTISLKYLEHVLATYKTEVLITSSDEMIAFIRKHREQIERHTHIALAQEDALAIAINKEKTLTIAQQLGINIPRSVVVRQQDEVQAAVYEIGLPAVVKPCESWVEQDCIHGKRFAPYLITTIEEASDIAEKMLTFGGAVLFQQLLTGRREAINLFYAHGTIYARFAQWAKRTEPPLGGQSVLRQSIALPSDIGPQAELLIREIGLEGYSEIEFRRDSAGVPYLMEINPRLSASVEIAVRSGVDFPFLLYQWASGRPIEQITSYRTGQWMRYLKGDFMTTLEAIQQAGRPGVPTPAQAIAHFWLTFLVPMGYDYVDWRDLAPALKASADFTTHWVGGAISKRFHCLSKNLSWRKMHHA